MKTYFILIVLFLAILLPAQVQAEYLLTKHNTSQVVDEWFQDARQSLSDSQISYMRQEILSSFLPAGDKQKLVGGGFQAATARPWQLAIFLAIDEQKTSFPRYISYHQGKDFAKSSSVGRYI